MNDGYYIFARSVDILFLILTCSLVIIIIIYTLIKDSREIRRLRNLEGIVSNLQGLASTDKEEMINGCFNLINKTTPFELSYTVKHSEKIFPGVFTKQLTECINSSVKVVEIEKIASKSNNKWRRIEAIILLGYLKSIYALDILKVSLRDKDSDVSYFSLLSLGRLKTEESAKILLAAIKSREFNGQKIASILEQFPPFIVELLIKSIDEKDQLLSFWSVKILSRFKPRSYVGKISRLTEDSSADLRAAACECLGQIAEESSKNTVKGCLKDSQWFVRMYAVRALEKISGDKCVPDVVHLIKDEHWFVREGVKEVLVKHFIKSLPFIEALLQQDDQAVRQSCIEIMDRSGYRDKILKDVISDNPEFRDRGQQLLAAMVRGGAHFGLEGVLIRYPDKVRKKILEAIASVDKDKAEHIAKKIRGEEVEL